MKTLWESAEGAARERTDEAGDDEQRDGREEVRVPRLKHVHRQRGQRNSRQPAEHPQPADQRNHAVVVLAPARRIDHAEPLRVAAQEKYQGGRHGKGEKLEQKDFVHCVAGYLGYRRVAGNRAASRMPVPLLLTGISLFS